MTNEDVLRRDVRKCQLQMLIKLDEVCETNHLRYYLACGTCIGALRHKGFIPWDDDVDVFMPYDDAKKLVRLQDQFGGHYFVQCKETDPDYTAISMRIRDRETTCIEKDEVGLNIVRGIYIDVYPLYECADNKWIRTLDILLSHLLKILVANRPPINHGKIIALISKIPLMIYSGQRRHEKIKKIEQRLAAVRGSQVLTYFGKDITMFDAITYPKEWFRKPTKLEFEGLIFEGPTEPDKYLRKRYGDYMKLPPASEQVYHHTYYRIDPYKSYTAYTSDLEDHAEGKHKPRRRLAR